MVALVVFSQSLNSVANTMEAGYGLSQQAANDSSWDSRTPFPLMTTLRQANVWLAGKLSLERDRCFDNRNMPVAPLSIEGSSQQPEEQVVPQQLDTETESEDVALLHSATTTTTQADTSQQAPWHLSPLHLCLAVSIAALVGTGYIINSKVKGKYRQCDSENKA
jgi:hypothetical protein